MNPEDVDWAAVLDAEKTAVQEAIVWHEQMMGGHEVARRFRLDLSARTHQGKFTFWAEGNVSGDGHAQFRVITQWAPASQRLLARLCRCAVHAEDDYPVHWHWLQEVKGGEKRPRAVRLSPDEVSLASLLSEFVGTMKIRNLQGDLTHGE